MTLSTLAARSGAAFLLAVLVLVSVPTADAQFQRKWLAGGSFHNWYAEVGSEVESSGFIRTQQDGWRWPGIYQFTDMQAWKGLWIGAENVTDAQGTQWPVRVVHAGPRVSGLGEFFPVRFELIARRPVTLVTVDGEDSFPDAEMVVDRVDPDLEADFVLVNEVNTLLGITMERRVLQFSQGFHDNYHVLEYTFTNTGRAGPGQTVPAQTLEGVYFFFQNRMSVAKESRYAIGNATGWGINAMNDVRGDGVEDDPEDERFRASFTWHGLFPGFARYPGGGDNLGAPLMRPAVPAVQISSADTLGRFAASQFAGVVTLHADSAPGNQSDDRSQPSTTTWIGSDAPFQSNNDAFSTERMRTEYGIMSAGHRTPRHARAVEPTGLSGYINPTGDPSLGTSGGYSFANGYGPYTLAPGESVRVVVAEGAAGLSREANLALGRQFKAANGSGTAPLTYAVRGQSHTMTKNEWVFTSRDSLFQTFRRAIANHESGYAIPEAPAPPASFAVRSGGDRITLEWEPHAAEPLPAAWEVYRARARVDSSYTLVHTAGPGELSFDDTTPIRGIDYYYYLVAVGSPGENTGAGGTPAGRALRSSRYATQTYVPAQLQRPQGRAMDDIRIVPNPFNIASSRDVRFDDRTDKLAFFNIPGNVRIDIYTELGELVDTIHHTDGSGDTFWDHTTSSRQIVASGVYIAVFTVTQDISDPATGAALFRQGERTTRKFVIIR
jgi:hypothetical protein